jgi:hypothetical protein
MSFLVHATGRRYKYSTLLASEEKDCSTARCIKLNCGVPSLHIIRFKWGVWWSVGVLQQWWIDETWDVPPSFYTSIPYLWILEHGPPTLGSSPFNFLLPSPTLSAPPPLRPLTSYQKDLHYGFLVFHMWLVAIQLALRACVH